MNNYPLKKMEKNTCKKRRRTRSDSKMNGNKYVFKLYKM